MKKMKKYFYNVTGMMINTGLLVIRKDQYSYIFVERVHASLLLLIIVPLWVWEQVGKLDF